MTIQICPHCKRTFGTVRICRKCKGPIRNYHKYLNVPISKTTFALEHRNCKDPESYK